MKKFNLFHYSKLRGLDIVVESSLKVFHQRKWVNKFINYFRHLLLADAFSGIDVTIAIGALGKNLLRLIVLNPTGEELLPLTVKDSSIPLICTIKYWTIYPSP